ncbi:MAG: phage terminase small subunit P27 family [Planctomycetes bacterium]|nr:phage terminase small subunit P27 family [Planctomycetota bacterium]
MKRGPKPLPTQLKLARGSRRVTDPLEPIPPVVRPTRPAHLSRTARSEWDRIAPELERLGLLTKLDRAALAAYCQAYGRWVKAEKEAAMHGLVVKTKDGNLIQNPYLSIANKAMRQMHEFLVEFGMTPSSRTRVTVVPPIDPDDPRLRFFRTPG